jgi:NAD(P)-dependent dehydrogenase (short-subunit alcohol dehydrogenase family)
MNNPATDKDDFPPTNVVLVTGSSSGIGKACCDRLANSGRRVYGSCRTQYAGQGWQYTRLDVNDEYSAHRAIEEVANREGCIDALVHCAGSSLAGSVEDTTVDEAKVQFDTNFFGTVRVLRAVLPVMRKQGHGKIIVIGSIGGLIALPFIAHYSASKFALNGLIEALRLEVAPWGIDATILHLGDFNTAISANQVCSRNATVASPYFAAFQQAIDLYDRNVRSARSPDVVAYKVESLLSRRHLPARCVVGSPIEVFALAMKAVMPPRGFEYLFRRRYGL